MMPYLLRIAYRLIQAWTWLARPVTIGVRIILVQDREVLLVRHTYMPGWHFPGGYINRGETPMEAAAREAREEAGAELMELPSLVGLYSHFGDGNSNHVAVYVCRKFRQYRATDRWEIAERKSFALDALPPEFYSGWRTVLNDLNLKDA
jgi:8-oxo-dGTP pyrophosphatase MutT (NUDIX family)